MANLQMGPLSDDLASQSVEHENTVTTPGEVLGATATDVFNALPVPSILRRQRRFDISGPDTQDKPAYDPRNDDSDVDAMAAERGDAPMRQNISADDANAQVKTAGAQGMTPFTQPTDARSVQSLIDDHMAKMQRADVIARNGSAILSGKVTQFALGALVSLADPLNDMAMMIPVVPEAFAAEKLIAAGSALGRTAVRAGVGAAEGAVGMAALEPLSYLSDVSDHEDWSAGEALRNIAFGAVLGAGGHAILGGLFGHLPPATQAAALRVSLANIMHDVPVDVAGLIDHATALHAAERLERWHAEQQRILAHADAGRTLNGELLPEWESARDAAVAKLEHLSEQHRSLDADIADTKQRLHPWETQGQSDLDISRTQAELHGLTVARENVRADRVATEEQLGQLRAENEARFAEAEANRKSDLRSQRVEQALTDSRESTLQGLMEREVRQYAGRASVTLEPGEAATIAREIRTAQPGEAKDIIANHLNALAARSDRPDIQAASAGPRLSTDTTTLRAEAQGAARDMATRAMNPIPDPAIAAATKENARVIASAPKLEGVADKDLAEVNAMLTTHKAAYDAEVASGRMAEHPSIADAGKDIADRGNAEASYAACIAPRM